MAMMLAACSSNGVASDGPRGDGNGDGKGQSDGGGRAGCGSAKPDDTNTGVPVGVALTEVDGDVDVKVDGTVIDGQDIHGFLIIEASHVTVSRSVVRATATTATTAAIRVKSGTDIVITDSEVAIGTPSVDVDGISASNASITRVNVHGGVDGMKLGDNAVVQCSYVHDMVSFASDPNQHGGATHNDAIQILGGANIEVTGNQLVSAKSQNSAIQVTQDFGLVTNLRIAGNWADGGGCTFNFAHKGGAALTVTTRANRFGRNSFFGCPILKSTQTTLDSTGDVFDDDGTPVPVQTHD